MQAMVDVIRDGGGEAVGVAGDCTEQRLATAAPHSCPWLPDAYLQP
jgi:hypothetical protein